MGEEREEGEWGGEEGGGVGGGRWGRRGSGRVREERERGWGVVNHPPSLSGPIMDVVEVEELEEDEVMLKSNVTLTPLSKQDLLDFYEGNLEEGVELEKVGGSGEIVEGEDKSGGEVLMKESGEADIGEADIGEAKDDVNVESEVSKESDLGSKGGELESKGEDLESKVSKDEDLESKESKGATEASSSKEGSLSASLSVGTNQEKPSVEPESQPSQPNQLSEAPPPTKPTSLLERRLTPGKSRMMSLLRMREVCGMSTRPTSPSGPGAIWDHEQLNRAQFVQLLELFVGGLEPRQALVDAVAEYIKANYMQAERVKKVVFPAQLFPPFPLLPAQLSFP